ncbi:MAG TPA: glycosyltransferase family protein, partial [Saprospiraceae bacterium]|nr:glycosyltransferase family protein [Saprospiraceae bacterium]
MNILYAVQATGNGHISRAIQLLPYLRQLGKVDVILSGNNYSLVPPFDVKYKSKGLSLHYSKCGSLDYLAFLYKNNYYAAMRDAYQLPVEKYDLVLNDFDMVTALACKIKGKESIQFGHQASFMSEYTPRPSKRSFIGETVLKKYAVATKYLGFHFEEYDRFITPPVIKEEVILATPKDLGHIVMYLPSLIDECLREEVLKCTEFEFHWFDKSIKEVSKFKNITFFPIDNKLFSESLVNCHGIITGGGFETPSEALYLGKRLLSVPIASHYEQQCNAAALEKLGVRVLEKLNEKNFNSEVKLWLNA